jgi:hypothetical protein
VWSPVETTPLPVVTTCLGASRSSRPGSEGLQSIVYYRNHLVSYPRCSAARYPCGKHRRRPPPRAPPGTSGKEEATVQGEHPPQKAAPIFYTTEIILWSRIDVPRPDHPVPKASPLPAAPRHPKHAQEGRRPQSRVGLPPQTQAGRPRGAPSPIVNLRMPVARLAELDRSRDRLEGQTGLQAHRGMLVRRAGALCLEPRASGTRTPALAETPRASRGTAPSVWPRWFSRLPAPRRPRVGS